MAVATLEAHSFFEQNLKLLEPIAPELIQTLKNHRPQRWQRALDLDDELVNIYGARLYGLGARRAIADNKVPQANYMLDLNLVEQLDIHTNALLKEIALYRGEHDIKLADHPDPKTAEIVAMMGVSNGFFLQAFLATSPVKVLLLIEPELDFWYHALSLIDWQPIVTRFQQPMHRLILNHATDTPSLIKNFSDLMLEHRGLLDNVLLVMHHLNPFFDALKPPLAAAFSVATEGYGFIEDERVMIENTVDNLIKGSPKILQTKEVWETVQIPFLLVGAGPSLDRDLPLIKAYSHNAVIMTCGSALRALRAAGIKVDFHCELENVPETVPVNRHVKDRFGIVGTTLIAATSCDPALAPVFEDTIFYFRTESTPIKLLADPRLIGIEPSGPTVANGALSLAYYFGFRTIVLFGVDFGTRDPKRHHASGTAFYDDSVDIDFDWPFPTAVEGNLGGTVYTEEWYDWPRRAMERAIQHTPELTVYNCSDGVKIAGTISCEGTKLPIKRMAIDKAKLLQWIKNQPLTTPANANRAMITLRLPVLQKNLRDVATDIDQILRKPGSDWLWSLNDYVTQLRKKNWGLWSLLSGTLSNFMIAGRWTQLRLPNPDAKTAYQEWLRAKLLVYCPLAFNEAGQIFDDCLTRISPAAKKTTPSVAVKSGKVATPKNSALKDPKTSLAAP